MRSRFAAPTLAAFVSIFVSGCFPIELDVNDKGELLIYRTEGFFVFNPETKKTTAVTGPGENEPVFARFVPGGKGDGKGDGKGGSKEILTVARSPRGEFEFDIVSIADGKARPLYTTRNESCYARFSPDGRYLAVTKMAERTRDDGSGNFQNPTPELVVIDVKKGTHKKFADLRVHAFLRWFQDSQRLLVLTLERQDKEGKIYGHLSVVDARTGTATPIVSLAGDNRAAFDLSPGNKKALLITRAVGPADKMPALDRNDFEPPAVHEIDLGAKTFRNLGVKSDFAIYSPSGKKVLLTAESKRFSLDKKNLLVADEDCGNAVQVADDFGQTFAAGGGTDGLKIPGWRNDNSLFYLVSRTTYGKAERSAWLKTIAVDGSAPAVVQPYLDLGVLEAEAKIVNPRRAPQLQPGFDF